MLEEWIVPSLIFVGVSELILVWSVNKLRTDGIDKNFAKLDRVIESIDRLTFLQEEKKKEEEQVKVIVQPKHVSILDKIKGALKL